MKKIAILCVCGLWAATANAQMLTREQAVQAALQNHPQMRAAAQNTEAKRLGERAARALPNPEVNAESPTGEFYAIGVLQSFDFPTVYKNRKKVAQAETDLARAGQKLTENELRYAVRLQFLEWQAAEMEAGIARRRDSIFQQINQSATRQFAAGEIDFLQKTLVENEAGTARQYLLAAQRTAENQGVQLRLWTGLTQLDKPEPLPSAALPLSGDTENPGVLYEKQAAKVAQQQVTLARSQTLPNFSLGYLNHGLRTTPIDYRFRATVGVPLWLGQQRSLRQSAEAAARAAESRVAASAQNIAIENTALRTEWENARTQIEYFEAEGLPRSRSLIETAVRLRSAGQLDYPALLRTINTALDIETEYTQQIKTLNAAQIRMQFLAGQ
jgi:outer membrane protein, heavy metal efflux system